MDGALSTTETNDLSSFEDVESALEGVLGVSMQSRKLARRPAGNEGGEEGKSSPLLRHKLPHKRSITSAPPNGQPPPDIRFDLVDLLLQIAPRHALDIASLNGVHGRKLEQTDRLVDVVLLYFCGEGHLGQGFGDADDGLELTRE